MAAIPSQVTMWEAPQSLLQPLFPVLLFSLCCPFCEPVSQLWLQKTLRVAGVELRCIKTVRTRHACVCAVGKGLKVAQSYPHPDVPICIMLSLQVQAEPSDLLLRTECGRVVRCLL